MIDGQAVRVRLRKSRLCTLRRSVFALAWSRVFLLATRKSSLVHRSSRRSMTRASCCRSDRRTVAFAYRARIRENVVPSGWGIRRKWARKGREERRGWLAGSIVGDFIYETHCYAKRGGTIGERDPPILLIPPRNPCRGCILESRKEIIPHFLRALLRDISRFRMPSLRFPMISSRALFQSRCIKEGSRWCTVVKFLCQEICLSIL